MVVAGGIYLNGIGDSYRTNCNARQKWGDKSQRKVAQFVEQEPTNKQFTGNILQAINNSWSGGLRLYCNFFDEQGHVIFWDKIHPYQ